MDMGTKIEFVRTGRLSCRAIRIVGKKGGLLLITTEQEQRWQYLVDLERGPWLKDCGNYDDDYEADDKDRIDGEARKVPTTTIDELVTLESSYERLFFNRGNCNGMDVLLITWKQLHDCPPAGYTSLACLSVEGNAQYKLQVLHTIESGELESTDQFKELCGRISDYSKYKFCPGFITMCL